MRRTLMTFALAFIACTVALAQVGPATPQPTRAFLQQVAAAVEIYTKKNDAPEAIRKLEALRAKEPKEFTVNSWLGFLYVKTGQAEGAVPVLQVAHAAKPKDPGVTSNLAWALEKTGDERAALQAYKELDALVPGQATTLAKIGLLSIALGQTNEGLASLERARAAAPGDATIAGLLAVGYQRAGKTAEAKAAYERLLELKPDPETEGTARSFLGFQAIQDKDYGKAVEHLERALALRETDLEVLNNLAYAYSSIEPPQNDKAADIYRRMVAMNPNLYEPWYNLGVLYLKAGQGEKAVEANKEALKRRDGEPYALNNLGRAYEMLGKTALAADSYAKAALAEPGNLVFNKNAGLAAAAAKQDDKAVVFLEKAVALGETSNEVSVMLGILYTRAGRKAEAIKLLTKASESVQNRADLWYNLGVLKQDLGDKAGAEDCYRKSLAIKPDDIDANQNLALLLMGKGDWAGALPLFEKVAGMNPGSLETKVNLAAVYFKAGRLTEAVQLWKDVVHAAPSRSDVRVNLAGALWTLGQHEESRQHYQLAFKDRPKDPQVLNGLGLWELREARNAAAEKLFRSAIASDPRFLPAYNNLAVTLERLNRRKEAIAVLERALKIDPNQDDAKKNLQRLRSADK